ncbi:Fanconi anemia group M protein [Cloeon dipterum]|uniref:Fanconi anemia group M protein n=1 Tax=Cloeon dipterum TaxID=197152 RepID=UPI00322022B2
MDRFVTSTRPGPSSAPSFPSVTENAEGKNGFRPIEDTGPLHLFSDKHNLSPDGFCFNTGEHWVYPTNYPERNYQLDIVRTALFQNTLVSLPTGLGKTFIAAVVMFNFYRWFPNKKIIFMAPTKPLVAQQVKACYDIIGIPSTDTSELTGTTIPLHRRQEEWRSKRIFFATPQVVANDLVGQVCPAADVCCIVFDEAHRAKGNQAYCQVMAALKSYNSEFRVLALSATPGSDKTAIAEVLRNLSISKLKLLTDESPEVKQHSHKKDVEVITVSPNNRLKEMGTRLLSILSRYLMKLMQRGVIPRSCNISNLGAFQLKTYYDKLNTTPIPGVGSMELNDLKHNCLVALNLSKAYEMLNSYGKGAFLNHISQTKAESTNKLLVHTLEKDEDLTSLIMDLESTTFDHPKLQKLEELLIMHFVEAEENGENTKVIIFSEYRNSVSEIKEFIIKHSPLIRPVAFVGQSKKGGIGLTQQEQKKIMLDFKANKINALISTCVGEEGLDIGEVDLIICYDANKSPIRLVQRMGRTGRKRDGRVVLLLTEGKEYQKYISSTKLHSNVNKNIGNWNLIPILNQLNSPRMVPRGVNPVLYRKVLVIKEEKEKAKNFFKKKSGPDAPPAMSVVDTINNQANTWQEPIPVFKYLESSSDCKLLSLLPFDEMKEKLVEIENDDEDKFNPFSWTEWLSSVQGTSDSPHSSDTNNLVALVKFANRMSENDATCFTQSTEIASEAANDMTFWSDKLSKEVCGKKTAKGKKNAIPQQQNQPSIAKMLQQKKVQKKIPPPPLFKDDDDDLFMLPSARPVSEKVQKRSVKEEIDIFVENLSLLHLLLPLKNDCPLVQMMNSVSLIANTVDVEEKPDFDFDPPDISILDQIFGDRTLNKATVEVVIKKPEISVGRDTFVKKKRTTPLRRSAGKSKPNVSTGRFVLAPIALPNPVKLNFNFDLDICSDSLLDEEEADVKAEPAESPEISLSDEILCTTAAEIELDAAMKSSTSCIPTSTPKVNSKFSSKHVISSDEDFDDEELLRHCQEIEMKALTQTQQPAPAVEEDDDDDVTYIDEEFLKQVSAIEEAAKAKSIQHGEPITLSTDEDKEDHDESNHERDVALTTLQSSDSGEVIDPSRSRSQSVASKRPHSMLEVSSDFASPVKKPKCKIRKKKRNPFALTQASVSDDSSSGEDSADMDQYDQSFIKEQCTQVDVDMQAEYLKTTRSPPINPKFKIPNLLNRNRNNSSDEAYLEDSFCVATEGSPEESEEDLLEVCEKRLREKRKAKRSSTENKKKTRIIIKPISSDSEDEERKTDKSFKTPVNIPLKTFSPVASTSKANFTSFKPVDKLEKVQQIPPPAASIGRKEHIPVPVLEVKPSFKPKPSFTPKLTNPEETVPKLPPASREQHGKTNIIASTNQIQRAPQLVTCLSTKHNLHVIIRTLPSGVDYVISQRLAVARIRVSDTSSFFPNSKLVDTAKSLSEYFQFSLLIFENDKDCPLPDIKKNAPLPVNKLRRTICFLQESKIKYIFCRNQEETAEYLAMLSSKEAKAESYGIDDWFTVEENKNVHFQFYSNLPHVNIVMALKLTKTFPSMSDFLERCNSAQDVMEIFKISDHRKANDIYRVLNEPWN